MMAYSTSTSSRSRNTIATIFIAALFWASAAAQQLLTYGANALPVCAEQCQILTQAQSACVPPAAPVTNQQTYLSCFCQSGYLTSLHTDATAICGSVCQGADLTQIVQWYANSCTAANIANAAQATPTTTTTTTPAAGAAQTPPATTTTTGKGTGTATASLTAQTDEVESNESNNGPPQSWWAGHWRWILMLILIAILLGLLAVGAILLRRRLRRRRDAMSGRFNDGITARSMTSVGVPGGQAYPARGRETPSMAEVSEVAPAPRGVSASTTTLSKVREEGSDSSGTGGTAATASDGRSHGLRAGR